MLKPILTRFVGHMVCETFSSKYIIIIIKKYFRLSLETPDYFLIYENKIYTFY